MTISVREQLVTAIEKAYKVGYYEITKLKLLEFDQRYNDNGSSWLVLLLIKDIENKVKKGL